MRSIAILAAFSLAAVIAATAAAAVPRSTAPPTVSGTPRQGQTLTANSGTWANSPTSFTYQWQRCNPDDSGCADVSSDTGKTYTLASADVDHRLRVVVTGVNADGQASATSHTTGTVSSSAAPVNTAKPTIAGTAKVGEQLTASSGSWTGGATSFTYQWWRCNSTGGACANIADSTARTYGVQSADVGQTLRVVVTAHNASGSKTTATSDATAQVQPIATTTTVATVAGNKAPTTSFISLRRVGSRVYARFRVCDDRAGKISVTEHDTKAHARSYTRGFTVSVTSCGAFSRNWTLGARFRTHGRYIATLQAQDGSGARSRVVSRSLQF